MTRTLLLALVVPLLSTAQTFTGAIAGRVMDNSNAAVPKTTVTITEIATNTKTETVTDETGNYTVSFLKPGVYRVSFTATGFKESVEASVELQLNQQYRLDMTMEIGAVSERVEVSSGATLVNYESPEIGHVVGSEQLVNLPLVSNSNRGRSPLLLAKLVPGVVSTSLGNINNFSFGGGRPVTNEILVDGLPTTNPSDETYTLTPSPDSVEEFKVLTTPFSAEFGHTGGGVMLLTTKSGTNEYHGSVYDLFRNRLLNTRNFFAPTVSSTKYVQNDPGGNLGGPVRLPGYDGRNKTFLFLDFNVTLASTGNLYTQNTPTVLERTGDFSQTFVNGKLNQIYDPRSTRLGPDGKTYVRDPFSGNAIPPAAIDPVGAKIASFYPNPTLPGAAQNYVVHPPTLNQDWQSLARIDHNFSSTDKMFARWGRYQPNTDAVQNIPNKANNSTAGGWIDLQAVVSETHIFSPRLFNDFRVGFVQEQNYTVASSQLTGELQLKGVTLDSFPIIQTAGNRYVQLGANASNRDRDRSWVFNDALVWQHGLHSVKMGGDFRRQMYNNYSPGKLPGSYLFGATFSSLPGDGTSGNPIADLLLGYPTMTMISINDYTVRQDINSAGLYIQDDYKITPKLVLNLGLRWEFDGPYTEANNQLASFNPTEINRTTGTPGEVDFAGRDGAPRHFSPNIYHDFLPRVGFAYNVSPKTVIRAGYGIYRLPSIGFSNYGAVSQYAASATFTSLDGVTPRYRLSDGVPAYSYNVDAQGRPNIPASLTKPSSSVTELETRDRTPYNQVWSFGVERQFGGWLAEVDYQANKGVKLPTAIDLDQLRPDQFGPNATQSMRPFPQYASVTALVNDGNSIYHALQAKLEHRWRSGLVVQAAYTFSKTIDDVDASARANGALTQNAYNRNLDRGIAGYDVPQRFVANYFYQIPVGRGGRYFSSIPVVKDAIGGWSFSGITEFQVGLPLTIKQQTNTINGFTAIQRPNEVHPVSIDSGNLLRWFDPTTFAAAAPYTLGNAPRFPLHGPGVNNWDLSVMRSFGLRRENTFLQFRAEFFSAFNHPNFGNPGNTIGTSNYGVISSAGGSRVTELSVRIFF